MRAHEFITEKLDRYDLPTWLAMSTAKIKEMIKSGEIPDNPDSIRAASKQLAMDNKDNVEGLEPATLSTEIENQLACEKISKKAHLSGDYGG